MSTSGFCSAIGAAADQREIEADPTAGHRHPCVGDLAQHVRDDQTSDREIMSAQMQDAQAKHDGEQGRHDTRTSPSGSEQIPFDSVMPLV